MSPHPKIQRPQPNDLAKDLLIVLYGPGGLGKTTTACQAPAPLALDCAGGLRFQSIDQWKVGSARDLAEALAYLKTTPATSPVQPQPAMHQATNGHPPIPSRESINGHGVNGNIAACPYRTVILDGLDHLYHRTVRGEGRDLRDRHRTAQETLHPLLFDLWALPLTKIIVLNEHRERDERSGHERIEMDLPPRTSELLDNAADVLLRCEARSQDTIIRARRHEDARLYVQAKTRTDLIKDGMRLRDVWTALGIR